MNPRERKGWPYQETTERTYMVWAEFETSGGNICPLVPQTIVANSVINALENYRKLMEKSHLNFVRYQVVPANDVLVYQAPTSFVFVGTAE